MINFGQEYFSNNLYFFLKKNEKNIQVYYSISDTIKEARMSDEICEIPFSNEKKLFHILEKATKSKKKFKKEDLKKILNKISVDKEEIEELIDFDGSFSNSKIPIHDPKMSPRKTMDQTVFSTTQPSDPVMRGYRVYYGESVMREEDLSGAFGYDIVSGDTYEECVDKMTQMEVENPEERCQAFGKSPKLDEKGQERLTEKEIKEIQKQKMIDMLEDLLVKKSDNKDIQKSDKTTKMDSLPALLQKNLKNLLKQSDKNGISRSDLIKIIRNEQ
jgi:hypothetical protein